LQILEGHNAEVTSVTFSLDTKHLASASDDRTVRLWDAETGQCLQTLEGHGSWVKSVAFSPDAKCLASASYDRIVRLWDTETGQCLQTFSINMLASFRLSFTPDSSHLQTDAGILTIDDSQGSHPPTELRSEAKYPTISGYGFNEDRCWITWNGCKVLWLPVSFRPVSFAVSESTVITGSVYGKLIIIRISADRLP
jgi:WD40 repeat protein